MAKVVFILGFALLIVCLILLVARKLSPEKKSEEENKADFMREIEEVDKQGKQ